MGPVLGAIIAGAISAIFSSGATIAQNKYNSPKSQLRRLRKAGLPLAFMYQGRVNQQTSTPQLSIDSTLGTTQQKNLEQQAPVQAGQAEKLKNENQALREVNTWLDDHGIYYPEGSKKYSGTNRQIILQAERDMKQTDAFIKTHEEQLKGIFANVEQKLMDENVQADTKKAELQKITAQLINLGKQAGLMDQLSDIRSWEQAINKTMSESLNSMPDFMQAVWTILYKLASSR